MTLQEDMDSKRNWTQSEIDALKSKYRRTHFTHFKPAGKKLKSTKESNYVWIEVSPGRWKGIRRKK